MTGLYGRLNLWRNCQIFFQNKKKYHFLSPLVVYNCSNYSAFSPILGMISLFNLSHCSLCVVIFNIGYEHKPSGDFMDVLDFLHWHHHTQPTFLYFALWKLLQVDLIREDWVWRSGGVSRRWEGGRREWVGVTFSALSLRSTPPPKGLAFLELPSQQWLSFRVLVAVPLLGSPGVGEVTPFCGWLGSD